MENYTAKIPLTLNITYKADEELTFDQIVNIIRMKAWSDNSDELELLNHHWAEQPVRLSPCTACGMGVISFLSI